MLSYCKRTYKQSGCLLTHNPDCSVWSTISTVFHLTAIHYLATCAGQGHCDNMAQYLTGGGGVWLAPGPAGSTYPCSVSWVRPWVPSLPGLGKPPKGYLTGAHYSSVFSIGSLGWQVHSVLFLLLMVFGWCILFKLSFFICPRSRGLRLFVGEWSSLPPRLPPRTCHTHRSTHVHT